MKKITDKTTTLELISYINALIKNEAIDFHKQCLNKKVKLIDALKKKIIGLGFSFLEMLFFLANDESQKSSKVKSKAEELLKSLAITNLPLSARTHYSIKCYLGIIPIDKLKEQHTANFQSLNEKARSTFLENPISDNLNFCTEEEIQQFMTPLITAICSNQIGVIRYILKNHTEWLHSVYFISRESNNIVERIFDPFIIAAQTQQEEYLICKLLKPYLKEDIAKNLVTYYKNAVKHRLSPNDQTPKIFKKVRNHALSSNMVEQKLQIQLIEQCFNLFTIKASKEDIIELMQRAIEAGNKEYLDEILLSENIFFSDKFNDFFLNNLRLIITKFPDLKYLELVLKEYNEETILKKKDLIADAFDVSLKIIDFYRIDNGLAYPERAHSVSPSSLKAITLIIKNNLHQLQLLNLDKLFSIIVKRFFIIKSKESHWFDIIDFELETFLKYAYELQDTEFFNSILEFALNLRCPIKSLSAQDNEVNLLTYLKSVDLEKFIVTLWQTQSYLPCKCFFSFIFSYASSLKLDEKLLAAAIKYRSEDFFAALSNASKHPVFTPELIVPLIDRGDFFFRDLLKDFGPDIIKLNFANNENIVHLVVRQPIFHFKEFVEFFNSYPELFNQGDANGLTPIHHAVLTKNHSFLEHASFLSDIKCDLNIEDNLGFTASNYAFMKSDSVSYNFLRNYGAREKLTVEKTTKMTEFKKRFLTPISPPPVSNTTSQQKNTAPVQNLQNRAQPQTNLNINPAQPMPQPVNQHQPVPQQNNGGNEAFHKRANNTHTASIHQSVAKSIQQLMKHYGDPNSEKIKATLKEISDYILNKIKKIRENLNLGLTDFIDEINKLLAMDRYINYISWQFRTHSLNPSTDDNRIVREVITQIPLYKIVVLVWQAAQDMSPEVNSSSALTEEDKTLRLDLVLDRFRRNGRGSNINDTTGKDLGTLDQQLCASGQVNNCVEPLEGLHNLIMILRTPESVQAYFSEKAHKLAFEFFKNFTAQQEEILSLLAQPILTDGQQVKINSFHSDVKSNVQMALEEHLRTKDNPSGMLTPETAKELLENLIYVDYEKMYFTERAIELSKEYFKKSVDSHVELYQLLNKQNRDTSEEEIVQDYFSKLRVYVKGQMKNFLITSENPTGMLTENTLLRILEELTTIEYNDVMKTLPQPKPVETNKRKFEEPINPITLIGQGDIFKKPKTKSKEPDLDDFIEAIEKELEQQERNPSPK